MARTILGAALRAAGGGSAEITIGCARRGAVARSALFFGGTVAACLDEVGADVTAVTTNRAIHAAVRDKGFRTTGESGERAVAGRIELGMEALEAESFGAVQRATHPPHGVEAARTALQGRRWF